MGRASFVGVEPLIVGALWIAQLPALPPIRGVTPNGRFAVRVATEIVTTPQPVVVGCFAHTLAIVMAIAVVWGPIFKESCIKVHLSVRSVS